MDIKFPHDNYVLMIPSIPTLEFEDLRLQEMLSRCRTMSSPKYVLGYVEQARIVIPNNRFNNHMPSYIRNPSITEMHKLFTLMKGFKKL